MKRKPAKRAAAAKRTAPAKQRTPAKKRTPAKPAKPTMSTVRRVSDDDRDEELAEEWTREIADPRLRYVHGVGASRWRASGKWPWQVHVWVMELVRDNALEVELRQGIIAALRAVHGVTEVAEEDREVWVVAGSPSGKALVSAAAAVVDGLADRARTLIEQTR